MKLDNENQNAFIAQQYIAQEESVGVQRLFASTTQSKLNEQPVLSSSMGSDRHSVPIEKRAIKGYLVL